jgi:hypothetical protein
VKKPARIARHDRKKCRIGIEHGLRSRLKSSEEPSDDGVDVATVFRSSQLIPDLR